MPPACVAAALVVSLAATAGAAEVDDARGDWQAPELSSADTPAQGDGRNGPDLLNVFANYVPKVLDVVLTVEDLSRVDYATFAIGAATSGLRERDAHYVVGVQVYDGGARFGPVEVAQILPKSTRGVSCRGAAVIPQGEGMVAMTVPATCLGLAGAEGKKAKRVAILPRVGRYTAPDRRSVWQFDTLDKPVLVRRDKPADACAESGLFGC